MHILNHCHSLSLSPSLLQPSESGASNTAAVKTNNKGHMLIRRKSYLPMDNDTSQALQQYKPHERLGVPNES